MTILGHYFVRRRVFANAMSSTGTALGLCTLPFLGNYLHTELGWRGSFLVLGAVLLNCCVCGAVMRPLEAPKHRGQPLMNHGPPPPEVDVRKEKGRVRTIWSCLVASLSKHMAFDQLRNNSRYCVYAIGITWMMLGFVVPLVYLVPYATANNMEQGRAALLLSILGIVNILVRPPFGIMFNLPWFKGRHIYVFASALLVNGLSNSICCIGPSFSVLLTYVTIYGLSMSVVGSLMFTVLMDIVEMSRFPSALGLLAIMESVTLLIGPPLAGKVNTRRAGRAREESYGGNVGHSHKVFSCYTGENSPQHVFTGFRPIEVLGINSFIHGGAALQVEIIAHGTRSMQHTHSVQNVLQCILIVIVYGYQLLCKK